MRQPSFILSTVTLPPKTQIALRFLWVLVISIVIVGSLLPNTSTPMRALDSLHLSDTVEHFGAYAFLTFLPALHERRHFIVLAALGIMLLGVSLEFAQLFADGRSWQFSDIAADAAGVCVGLLTGIPMRSALMVRLLLSRTTR